MASYEYRTRKGQALVFTAAALTKRLLALVPPERVHLTRFHGVFAPNANLRRGVMRAAPGQAPPPTAPTQTGKRPATDGATRRPRLDWASLQRRTFDADVWQCHCGGRRHVVAVVTNRRTAEEVLRNLRPLSSAQLVPRPG